MNKIDNRQIRIFISSTFQDMQDERDYLITKVFPKLQVIAAKRYVSVVPLDLRWGITENEANNGKVIEICLQEIENSHPFFIGIIGNRYGWCPTLEELNKNEFLKERWGEWLKKDIINGLSVTEIEMQYGVLRSKEKLNAYFYIKVPENNIDINADKLHKLKKQILHNGRYPVEYYDSAESLGQSVEKEFINLLNELYPEEAVSDLERERMAYRAFMNSRTQVYIPDIHNYERLDSFIEDSNLSHFVILGDSGTGKSALIANWILRQKTNKEWNIVYFFVGCNGSAEDSNYILLRLINEIRDLYHISASIEDLAGDKPKEKLAELFSIIKKPLLIVIDGVNQIVDINKIQQMNWLPQPTSNIKYLFTALECENQISAFLYRNYSSLIIKNLSKEQRKQFVSEFLMKYHKKLSDEQIYRIVNCPICENTLVLHTLLNELISFGYHEQLNQQIGFYLQSESIEAFFLRVLERYEKAFGNDKVKHLLALIAVAHTGISETELQQITHFSQLDCSQFFCAFRPYFVIVNGLIGFSHQYIPKAVELKYLHNNIEYRKEIVNLLYKKNPDGRDLEELAFQYHKLEKYDELFLLILSPNSFSHFVLKNKYELGEYWKTLQKVDKNRFPLSVYLGWELDEKDSILYEFVGSFVQDVFGDYSIAQQYYQKAYDINPSSCVLYSIGTNLYYQGRYKEALDYFLKALDSKRYSVNGIPKANLLNNIGAVYYDLNNIPKALELFKEALEMKEKNNAPKEYIANSYHNISLIYSKYNQREYTFKYLKKALELRECIFGPHHIETASSYEALGLEYSKEGDHQEAIKYYQKTLGIYKEALDDDHPDIADVYNSLGEEYLYIKNYSQAFFYLKLAQPILESKKGCDHIYTGRLYSNLGNYYRKNNSINESIDYYQKAYSIYVKYYGEDNSNVSIILHNIGITYYDFGEYKKAIEYFQQALTISKKLLGEEHEDTKNTQEYLYRSLDYYQAQINNEKEEANQSLSPEELFNIGNDYFYGWNYRKVDEAEAVKWYKKAAEAGFPEAQTRLGYCYSKGIAVSQDFDKAFNWYQEAANNGDINALVDIGFFYFNGTAVDEDDAEAFTYFYKAAELGNPTAQYVVGECYFKGYGVERNKEEAFKWYYKAAENGVPDAQYYLGECYQYALGVAEDYNKAVYWYDKAAHQYHRDGIEKYRFFKKRILDIIIKKTSSLQEIMDQIRVSKTILQKALYELEINEIIGKKTSINSKKKKVTVWYAKKKTI